MRCPKGHAMEWRHYCPHCGFESAITRGRKRVLDMIFGGK